MSEPCDCGCGRDFRKPKPNGTCATCGGWLPGERPLSLTAMWSGESTAPERVPTPITDEMAATVHDRLRAGPWNDLHSWELSGADTQQTVRLALDAALNGGER